MHTVGVERNVGGEREDSCARGIRERVRSGARIGGFRTTRVAPATQKLNENVILATF